MRREVPPATDHGPVALALEQFVPYRLSVLSNRISGAIARSYSDRFGMTIPEWRVMAVLGRHPGLAAGEIAERTAMDKVQVSRAVARLAAHGRLTRRRDPDDGRSWRLSLTREGTRIHDDIVPLARAFEARLLAALGPGEAGQVLHLLDALDGALDGAVQGL